MSKRRRKHHRHENAVKRPCPVASAGIEEVNYKDIEFLKLFLTGKGKIMPRRISGLSARSQKKVTAAIKRARNIALISFSKGYVPQVEVVVPERRPYHKPNRVVESKPAESTPAENKPAESKPAESTPAASKPAETTNP